MKQHFYLLFRSLLLVWAVCLSGVVFGQDRTVGGRITDAEGQPLPGATVQVRGTSRGTTANAQGRYQITARDGQTLIFRLIGMQNREVTLGGQSTLDITLNASESSIDEVVVTAMNIPVERRSLGNSTSQISGPEIAQTQRDNFVNGLQGRVAGVTVTGTSGMPGSSSSIVIRGINSISGNNQPLFVIDGLPISNNTFGSTAAGANLVADRNSGSAFNNRTVDFQNRAGDLNPDDIESMTILKGPEAAALYGVEAANGAILITTRKGRSGQGRVTYSANFTLEKVGALPELQNVYSKGANGIPGLVITSFGPQYADNVSLYDNYRGFFQDGFAHRHNLGFEGGTDRYTFRLSGAYSTRRGVVPTTQYDRLNISLNSTAKLTSRLSATATLQYINSTNVKVSRGQNSFLLGMLIWPLNDNMAEYLNADGTRKVLTASASEIENPYFDVNKNFLQDRTNRMLSNISLNYQFDRYFSVVGQIGLDVYASQYLVKYHPESNRARSYGGSLDQSTENNRNLTLQYYANYVRRFGRVGTTLRLGNSVYDYNNAVLSTRGEKFLVANFTSINNTDPLTQRSLTNLVRRRLVGVWGSATFDYDRFVYLTVTGRNDWSSTFPVANRSFFYPSASLAFEFTRFLDNTGIKSVLNYGKLRLSTAQVGKEAPPYSLAPALEAQQTTGGGFAYGFTAPNPYLRPERVYSSEIGGELHFFNSRIKLDVARYKTRSVDQIIRDLRISYGTGFILKVINGGELQNTGTEITLDLGVVKNTAFQWNTILAFNKMNSKLLRLPANVSEFYDSDTWVYSNIRNGVRLGNPLTTFTGNSYQRSKAGQILISPTSGLPLSETLWNIVGDRNPDFTLGINNMLRYRNMQLSFLVDLRKGGDVYNATKLFMFNNGLSNQTLDRMTPRVFNGVLKDGLENTATPTVNTIQVTPFYQNAYYTSQADEYFIEKDINWVRLKDITLRYSLPVALLTRSKVFKAASIYFTGTDLLLLTNYSGGDPGVNAVTPARGGSGGGGIDFGNLPLMKTYNAGITVTF